MKEEKTILVARSSMPPFEEYVEKIIKADEEDDDNAPVCIFPSNCGECYVKHRDLEFGCMNCFWASAAYMSLRKKGEV